jgi:cyclophilin family peptidyl-prolyl cis-trans isomerase
MAYHVPVGQPVWVLFSIENLSDEPITLTVPGTEPEIPQPEMGLPICHVFSGNPSSGVTVITDSNRRLDKPVGYRSGKAAPILIIAPHSTVGTTVDIRDYYPVVRGAGHYRFSWQPYGGRIISETVSVTIAQRKQVEIVTDDGTMTMQLFYQDAPAHVANFIELAQSGFYNGKTFHRLEPGYLLLGGCPRGDGYGIRADGKRIPAEFNTRPHQKGSVSMALLEDDPDSGSCQFFLCNTRQKDWDGRYTVFGQLEGEESFATLDRLMSTPVDDKGRPVRTLYMRTVRVVDAPSEPLYDIP